jgi:hypothetical protein
LKDAALVGGATALLGTVGGILPALVHSALTQGGSPEQFAGLLGSNLAVVAGIGAGQGLAAGAAVLVRGRGHQVVSLRRGLTAAFAVGGFNGLMYFVQMAVPSTELGWALDLAILGTAGAVAGGAAVRGAARPAATV